MIILGIRLRNIRSYRDQVIVFPWRGVTTIYGDIGTGKTTILSSISYALFGRQSRSQDDPVKGYAYPKPDDLLRQGTSSGFIKLLLFHQGKLLLITRNIERRGDTYSDAGGSLKIYEYSGDKLVLKHYRQYTAKELRNKVLEELGFKELVREGMKPLVFTNALYVPQFNVTEVMSLSSEERDRLISYSLAIDKYYYIKKNIEELTSSSEYGVIGNKINELRSREELILKEQLEGKAPADWFIELNKQIESEKRKIEELNKIINDIEKELDKINTNLRDLSKEREDIRGVMSEVVTKLKQIEELERKYSSKKQELERFIKEIGLILKEELIITENEVREKISELEKERSSKQYRLDEVSRKEIELENVKKELENTLSNLKSERSKYIGIIEAKQKELSRIKEELNKIIELVNQGICPVCKQKIIHDHGEKLVREKRDEIEKISSDISKYMRDLDETTSKINSIEEKLSELESKLSELKRERQELISSIGKLSIDIIKLESELVKLIRELMEMKEKISEKNNLLKKLSEVKNKLDVVSEEEKKYSSIRNQLENRRTELVRELGRVESNLKNLENKLESIKKASEELERIRYSIGRYEKFRDFLNKDLKSIATELESIVRSVVLVKFRDMFKLFLNKLMEDHEIIDADIDADFTVLVRGVVDGKLQRIPQPSGGQLVGISLAYRLALNSVVRSLNPVLHDTVLLLDEPTTGFSPERVDKLRKLFRELSSSFGQVIIVTHESKLVEIGDCRIKLSIDSSKLETSVKYSECFDEESLGEYRRVVEEILSDREPLVSEKSSVSFDYFKSFIVKEK